MSDEDECPPDCMACSGEACDFCGAGCWNNEPNRPPCEHDVITRHERPPVTRTRSTKGRK